MRVMLDTNILISAIVFNSRIMNEIIERLANKYSLVLCSYIIDELHEVVSSNITRPKIVNHIDFLKKY